MIIRKIKGDKVIQYKNQDSGGFLFIRFDSYIDIWLALTKANFDAYKDLSEYMEFSNVVIKFGDIPYSIYREDELEEETICSDLRYHAISLTYVRLLPMTGN